MERVIRHFNYFLVLRQKPCTETPFTRTKKIGTARQIFGTMPRLPGGSLGTPKILSTGAILHLAPIRLHVENWECRARFFSACK